MSNQKIEVKVFGIGYKNARNLDLCGFETEYDKASKMASIYTTFDKLNAVLVSLKNRKAKDIKINLM